LWLSRIHILAGQEHFSVFPHRHKRPRHEISGLSGQARKFLGGWSRPVEVEALECAAALYLDNP